MKSSIEKFPQMIEILRKSESTPNKLAIKLHSDRRTIEKLLKVATKMKFVDFKSLLIENRDYRIYFLTSKFKTFLGDAKWIQSV